MVTKGSEGQHEFQIALNTLYRVPGTCKRMITVVIHMLNA